MNTARSWSNGLRWLGAARTPASAVAYSLVCRVGILFVNVATGIVVARTLGPDGRGIAAAASLWPFIIAGLLTLGVPAALRYEIPRKSEQQGEVLACAIVISALLGLAAFAIGYALVPRALAQYSPGVIAFAQLMMIFAPSMLFVQVLQAFYEAQGDFKQSNLIAYLPPVATLGALLTLHAMHALSPFSVPIAYEAPFGVMALVSVVRLRRFLRVPPLFGSRLRALAHYGVRAYGIDIVNTLASRIDQALVVGLLSSTSFGLYVVALSGARIPSVIGVSLNTVLFPTAAGRDGRSAIALVSRSARLVFASTLLAGLVFIAAVPVLVPLMYGREYTAVIGLTQLLTVGAILSTTTLTLNQAFMATGRPEIATLLQGIGLVITIPLMLVLMPSFGITGAAYALDLSYALRLTFVIICYPIVLHENIPGLVPTRADLTGLLQRLRRAAA